MEKKQLNGLSMLPGISNIFDLIWGLNLVKENKRLEFILIYLGIDFIKSKARSANCLIRILNTIPEHQRLEFITEHLGIKFIKSKIKLAFDLSQVLNTIPEHQRLVFVIDYLGIDFIKSKIRLAFDLSYILNKIPADKAMGFIVNHLTIDFVRSKVNFASINNLDWILQIIPKDKRMECINYLMDKSAATPMIDYDVKLKQLLANIQENEHTKLITNSNYSNFMPIVFSNFRLQQLLAQIDNMNHAETEEVYHIENKINILVRLKLTV